LTFNNPHHNPGRDEPDGAIQREQSSHTDQERTARKPKGLALPPSILRRVAYPVEPFDFKLWPRELPPPLLKGNRDRFWQQPGLFEQVQNCPTDVFKYIHKEKSWLPFAILADGVATVGLAIRH
jgi:hypothetical protein